MNYCSLTVAHSNTLYLDKIIDPNQILMINDITSTELNASLTTNSYNLSTERVNS